MSKRSLDLTTLRLNRHALDSTSAGHTTSSRSRINSKLGRPADPGLDDLEQRNVARVVPGHGPKTMELPEALAPQKRYLSAIADDVRRQIAEGKTLEEATKSAGFSEKDAWELFDQYHVRNVTAAYAELEWE